MLQTSSLKPVSLNTRFVGATLCAEVVHELSKLMALNPRMFGSARPFDATSANVDHHVSSVRRLAVLYHRKYCIMEWPHSSDATLLLHIYYINATLIRYAEIIKFYYQISFFYYYINQKTLSTVWRYVRDDHHPLSNPYYRTILNW